jgi:uncharacterized cupin superfamily protein
MIQSFDAFAVSVNHEPMAAEAALTDGVSTAIAELTKDVGLEVGIWEHSVGNSHASYGSEVFVILEGRGRITDTNGGVIELKPGVVGVLHEGDDTTWEITEKIRKVWLVRGE